MHLILDLLYSKYLVLIAGFLFYHSLHSWKSSQTSVNPPWRKKKISWESSAIRKELLVSLSEAKQLLWTTGQKLNDEQIAILSEFTEHLWTYFIELHLSWKLA